MDSTFSIKPAVSDKESEEEIIEKFARLVNRSVGDKTNSDLRNIVSKLEKRIKDDENYLIKMFLLNTRSGMLINSDNAPNISFRVDTINSIFSSIVKSLEGKNIPQEEIDDIFFDAGYNCGLTFGQDYMAILRHQSYIDTESEKIAEWCKFDSSVGWGKLTYDEKNSKICIENNFQIKPNDKTDEIPRNCSFFRGYITAVLKKIKRRETVTLTCHKENCPTSASGSCCCFIIN